MEKLRKQAILFIPSSSPLSLKSWAVNVWYPVTFFRYISTGSVTGPDEGYFIKKTKKTNKKRLLPINGVRCVGWMDGYVLSLSLLLSSSAAAHCLFICRRLRPPLHGLAQRTSPREYWRNTKRFSAAGFRLCLKQKLNLLCFRHLNVLDPRLLCGFYLRVSVYQICTKF